MLLAAAAASTTSLLDTYPRQTGVDAIHYIFRLALGDASDEITGEATITVKFLLDRVGDVQLDLASLTAGKGMTVASVRRGGVTDTPGPASDAIVFTHANNRLRLVLPTASRAGEEFTFTIRYRGIPAEGLRFINNIHGERSVFSENWPNRARHWLPMIDHPYDKATGEFIVTAPNHYQVVANGLLIEELDLPNDGAPHALEAIGADCVVALRARRGAFLGAPRRHHQRRAAADVGRSRRIARRDAACSKTCRAARWTFFVSHIGPYPYEKLANVQAAGLNGGTEHASAIFYGEKGVTAGRGPVVHEIAHQWWGNSVTERDWDDVWLSEGFATYFTLLFTEHDEGRDAFVDGLQRSRAQVLAARTEAAGHAGDPSQPVGHEQGAERSRLSEGRLGAAHAARRSRHRALLDGDPRLLPPLSRSERVDRGAARGVRTGVGEAARLVLRAVAEPARRAEGRRLVALPAGAQSHRSHGVANTGRRSVPARR